MTTPKPEITESAGPAKDGPVDVCDSCCLVAHDAGFRDDLETQSRVMREAGEVLHDHLCDAREEPEYYPDSCGCGCYRVRRGA